MLERAAGFAIFTVVKAGFVFSARAGSGIVIARLDDGCECQSVILRGVDMRADGNLSVVGA